MHFPGEPNHPVGHLLSSWLKRLALLPRSLVLQEVVLEGISPENAPESVAYLGEGESLSYIKGLLFREVCTRSQASHPCRLLHRRAGAHRSAGSLLIVELNRLLASLLPPGGFISYPWVRQKIFLSKDLCRGKTSHEKEAGRRVRKYGYRNRLAGPESVAPFYHQLYVPYAKHRYGESAHHRSFRELHHAVRSGFVLQVWEGETWVAGEVYGRRGDTLFLLALGCLPPYDYHRRRGALAASEYFGLQWARKHGIKVLDLFRSRPHAADGVFQHKSHWGAEPLVDPWVHTVLWLSPPADRGLPAALEKLLVLEGGALVELGQLWPGTAPRACPAVGDAFGRGHGRFAPQEAGRNRVHRG